MRRYHQQNIRQRRPFWLPASNFYVLAAAATLAVFFLIWGLLHDGGLETPLVPAGLGASIVLASAVFLREVVLRRARNRFLAHQRSLDRSVAAAPRRFEASETDKLTLEKNAAILRAIEQKSQAAKTLQRLAAAHREVFDLCEEYLLVTHRELPYVGVGSPRLAAIRRGQERANDLRHYHLLRWASLETRTLAEEARARPRISERMEFAQRALSVVDFASGIYPDEAALVESEKVLNELLTSIKVADLVQKAERAAFKGNRARAVSHYKDALFVLERERSGSIEHQETVVDKIRSEIEKIENSSQETGSRLSTSNKKPETPSR